MKELVSQFIKQERLFSPKDKIAVGVSGGADSVALLAVLCELGYDCIALHCNFHLRGEESMRDEHFVTQWVKTLNIPYRKVDFETEAYASEQKISIEMAARELRYRWFAEQKEELGASCIAIAHHADDVVETFLINLTRGSGIHGLTGIKPKNGEIVRPLLCVSRKDILQYLKEKGLQHVEDSTNQETIYVRNKFRNTIIPLFESINPSFKESVVQTIANLRNAEEFLEEKTEESQKKIMIPMGEEVWHLPIAQLKKEKNPKFLLYELLRPFKFTAATIKNVVNALDGPSGKTFQSADYTLQKDREVFILSPKEDEGTEQFDIQEGTTEIRVPIHLTFETLKAEELQIEKEKRFCYLDYDQLTFPLIIRKWEMGDYFVPFGMKGKKKLSDYFVDKQFSLYQKKQTWLLLSGEQIVWIIGERSDNRYRVTSKTKKILKISLMA